MNMPILRPKRHFCAPRGWLNDPNGLICIDGVHHLFYQSNPLEPRWNNIGWGHATSSNLIDWQHQPAALMPEKGTYDAAGCWSGSALWHAGQLYLFYTATSHYDPTSDSSRPSIAVAKGLQHFTKALAPVLQPPQPLRFLEAEQLEWVGWRDPIVWREGERFLMTVGAGQRGRGGVVLLYQSTDLEQWTFLGEMIAGDDIGGFNLGEVWECPQLLRFADGDALVVCPWENRKGFPPVVLHGRLHGSRLEFARLQTLDAGDFYAPQAWQDESGRWLMLGWLIEQRAPVAGQQQVGAMSLVREVWLEDGLVLQRPARENLALRGSRLAAGQGSQHFWLTAQPNDWGWFGVRVLVGENEYTEVYVDPVQRELVIDRRHSSLDAEATRDRRAVSIPSQIEKLEVIVDGGVVEAFCGGAAMAVWVYPTRNANQVVSLWQTVFAAWRLR